MKDIEQVLDFIVEIDKLKDIYRKTRPTGLCRYENSAEHSWQVCLAALMLKDYADEIVDINRVIIMLLIHDLGEIDAGDTIVYEDKSSEAEKKEEAGVMRILKLLPNGKDKMYMDLWYEFEKGETPDAQFAKAMDRVPPVLHNLYGKDDNWGHSWRENKVSKEQVFTVNSSIAKGSKKLWQVIKAKLETAIEQGIFK